MKRLFAIFICFACILFLMFSPSIIAGGVHKNIYTVREQKKQNVYRGTLVLWHVVSFPTPETGGVTYLTERASAFERQHPYVYVDVIGMTPEEAEERKKNGESPDILSFPMGYLNDASSLAALEPNKNIESVFSGCGTNGTTVYAYPYMADAYVLMVNEAILVDEELSLPAGDAMDREALSKLLARNKIAITDLSGSAPASALALTLGSSQPPDYIAGTENFLDGSVPLCLCTYGEYAKISEAPENSALDISVYSISRYTDLVQMIGVLSCSDAVKEEICSSLSAFLLTATSQRKLEATGMLPVRNVSDIFSSPYYGMFAYLYKEAEIPPSFPDSG